jgi:hypothetical protein
MSEQDRTAGAASAPDLPILDDPAKALTQLRRPFAPAAIKWKIQASWPKEKAEKAIVIGYIDARLVVERLNMVVGPEWAEKPVRIEGVTGALMYELTVCGQTHVDVGTAQGSTNEMKLKAVHSDALKRTAVRFGVGVSLYAMPRFTLPVTDREEVQGEDVPTIGRRKDGKPGQLRETHERYLRAQYEAWLKDEGEKAFGEALDHGDAPDSVGDLAEDAGQDEGAAQVLSDERADELRAEARQLRDEVRELDPDALPQQSFDTAMAQREHSHDRLEDFIANLRELKANVERFVELEGDLGRLLDDADLKKVVDTAKRRGSRAERVEVLQKALDEAVAEAEKQR